MQLPPLPDELAPALRAFAHTAHTLALREHASGPHVVFAPPGVIPTIDSSPPPARTTDAELDALVARLASPEPWPEGSAEVTHPLLPAWPEPDLVRLVTEGPLRWLAHPVHRVRLLAAFVPPYSLLPWLDVVEAHTPLAERGVALEWSGQASAWRVSLEGASREDMEPLFREQPELGVDAIRSSSSWWGLGRWWRLAVRVFETWSPRPPEVDAMLFDLALGNAREARARVRPIFANDPARVVAALDDRSADRRASAADWLPELLGDDAIAPLTRRFRKEKSEPVRVALLTALQRLRADVDELLDRDALATEAVKRSAKLQPPAWIAALDLPELRWSDGVPVSRELARAWVVTAHKDRKATPSPMLCFVARRLDGASAASFAVSLLRAFLAHDTRRQPLDVETDAALRASAERWARIGGGDAQARYESMRESAEVDKSTAIADKGVLAVVAAMGGSEIAPEVRDYLRRWYGWRAAQCKALLQMLAWVDDRGATTLLLATSARFRTPGIRKEAELQVKALAERHGWTVDELADRTLPVAGLDESGQLELTYRSGPEEDAPVTRRFVARLDEHLELGLHDEEGARLKALPAPRKGEDEKAAKDAKATLSRSKRALKELVRQLRDRLYVAMCTERKWVAGDWRTYLVEHPIARHVVTTLVWRDEAGRTFRPTPEGDLVDASSNPVTLADGTKVSLAHALHVSDDEARAWLRHVDDYELWPTFSQFGRASLRPEMEADAKALTTHLGHVVSAFALRAAAKRLGYERGPTEDGGWFSTYVRALPSVGWTVVIEHTGNAMPEEDRPVALREARVEVEGRPLPLGEVGAVLTSELYADLVTLSAEGEGFVADWEKRVGWV